MIGTGRRQSRVIAAATLAAVLLVDRGAPRADLPTHDENGGYTLSVSFDLPTLLESGYVEAGAFTEERYCAIFERLSHHLWQTTEMNHWVRRVDFRLGVTESDINWFFRSKGTTSYGSFKNSVVLNENYGSSSSPINDGATDPTKLDAFDDGLAWLLDHELGHFLYSLKDEYNHGRERGAQLGLCSGFVGGTCNADSSILCVSDSVCDDANAGDTCNTMDKESCETDADCTGSETCIKQEVHSGEADESPKICNDHDEDATPGSYTECEDDADCAGLDDPQGNDAICVDDKTTFLCAGVSETTYCWEDEDCQQDGETGWCVREGEGGQASTRRICRDDSPSVPPLSGEPTIDKYRNRTSSMASSSGGGRWCDEDTHLQTRVIQRGKGGAFDEDGGAGDPEYTLGLDADYTSWGRAVRSDLPGGDDDVAHPDLRSYFDARTGFPTWASMEVSDFEAAVDFDAEFDCNWFIDEIPQPGDNTMIIVDKSGSMDYDVGTGSFVKSAFEWAAEGALVALEQSDDDNWVGILAFADSDDTVMIQPFAERQSIAVPDDPFDDFFAGVGPEGATDIGYAISEAVDEMAGQGPTGSRNIILMSDGANTETSGPTPLEAAQAACDAGIRVHTIAYGDADVSALKEVADLCEGLSVAAGNENNMAVGDDPHLLKGEFARMKLNIGGLDQIYRDVTGSLSDAQDLETRAFWVPEDSGPLTFTWVGNEVPFCKIPFGSICQEWSDTWSELVFSLESPGGQTFAGSIGKAFQAAATVAEPEAGWWQARIDVSAVPTQGPKREDTRVIWLGHIDHRDLMARAWVDRWKVGHTEPVVINASMHFKAPLTKVLVVAEVIEDGQTYANVVLFDDGQHHDQEAGDSIYGGVFNPDGLLGTKPGAYSVKVRFVSLAGISRTVTMEGGGEDPDDPATGAGSAYVEADTWFVLERLPDCTAPVCPPFPGSLDLPFASIPQGPIVLPRVVAQVDGLPLVPGRVGIDLGPGVHVANLSMQTLPPTAGGPPAVGELTFDMIVDPNAAIGTHTATVWVGSRQVRTTFEVTCPDEDLAAPSIDSRPLHLAACGGFTAEVALPLPEVSDACGTAPVDLYGWVVAGPDGPIAPQPIDLADPRLDLPFGESWILWEAYDAAGNVATDHQRVVLERSTACATPGRVPDGASVPGRPLTVDKVDGERVRLDWAPSCGSGIETDYAVYAGPLGSFDRHLPATCSTGGATRHILRAGEASYFLVVATEDGTEGSYGRGAGGREREASATPCGPQIPGECPAF